jgi:rubrerythrin
MQPPVLPTANRFLPEIILGTQEEMREGKPAFLLWSEMMNDAGGIILTALRAARRIRRIVWMRNFSGCSEPNLFRREPGMVKGIDFSGISLKDALDLAILIEEEAMDRYREFTDQMELHHTPEAAAFFRAMVANETKHRDDLFVRRQAMFPEEGSQMRLSMLWDVEAPEYDKARAFMSARQAMEVALECEKKAHDYFDQALKNVADREVRKLFEELREEELEHQRLVQRQMEKLPPDSGANPEDYADEPSAQ